MLHVAGYLSWLARCYMMNGKARDAWELYLKMESNTDSFAMLVLIANDCYKVGSFYYAAKAFDVLERLDPLPDYWDGKRGACCGVFQQVNAALLSLCSTTHLLPLCLASDFALLAFAGDCTQREEGALARCGGAASEQQQHTAGRVHDSSHEKVGVRKRPANPRLSLSDTSQALDCC
jgi:hypothetical protein